MKLIIAFVLACFVTFASAAPTGVGRGTARIVLVTMSSWVDVYNALARYPVINPSMVNK